MARLSYEMKHSLHITQMERFNDFVQKPNRDKAYFRLSYRYREDRKITIEHVDIKTHIIKSVPEFVIRKQIVSASENYNQDAAKYVIRDQEIIFIDFLLSDVKRYYDYDPSMYDNFHPISQ